MLGEKMKRTVSVRPISLTVLVVCLAGLIVSTTILVQRAIYEKQIEGKDLQILAAEKNFQLLSDKNIELRNSIEELQNSYKNLESRYKNLAANLILSEHAGAANTRVLTSEPPPVEQPLVREGEFAVELATAFNLTSSRDEAAAESYLASINITPRNGWISDYPVTPDIIAEVRESVSTSASSGYLRMGQTDAVGLVDNISIAMNLPVKAGYESGSEDGPHLPVDAPESPEYMEPAVIEDYYEDNRPPVVTYYPPPPEYVSLYEWVPSSFWWGDFQFRGFFILVDFERRHHRLPLSNHVRNPNGAVSRIKATARAGIAATQRTGLRIDAASAARASSAPAPTSSDSTLYNNAVRGIGGNSPDKKRAAPEPRSMSETASRLPAFERRSFNGASSPNFSSGSGYGSTPGGTAKSDGSKRSFEGAAGSGGRH